MKPAYLLVIAAFGILAMWWSRRRGWIGGFYGGHYYRDSDPAGYRRQMRWAAVFVVFLVLLAAFGYWVER